MIMIRSITIHHRNRAKGLTMVELMVASVLGLMIIGTVIYLLFSSKVAFNENERFGAINENSRYAMSVLSDELRLVDFWGQTRVIDISNDPDLPAVGAADCTGSLDVSGNGFANGYNYANSLWATTAAAATVEACITDAVVNSDVIFIKHVAKTPTLLADLVANRTYLMANDTKGVLFNENDASPPSDIVGGDVPSGTVWEYMTAAYYVRTVVGQPALYRKRLIGNIWENPGQEVAIGVERLHLEFGIDNNNDAVADFFVNSNAVTAAQWSAVVAVKIFLLVRSATEDRTYTNAKTYQLGSVAFGGATYTPNDKFYRTLFNTSVTLRNRRLLIMGGL